MDKKTKEVLSRLTTPSDIAKKESISIQAVYKRIKKGAYETVEICGKTYIIL